MGPVVTSGDEYQANACDKKWFGFGKKGGLTLRTLIFKVSQKKLQRCAGHRGGSARRKQPMTNARKFLEAQYSCEEGTSWCTMRMTGTHTRARTTS